jgi:hypothetical protein
MALRKINTRTTKFVYFVVVGVQLGKRRAHHDNHDHIVTGQFYELDSTDSSYLKYLSPYRLIASVADADPDTEDYFSNDRLGQANDNPFSVAYEYVKEHDPTFADFENC